MFEVGIYTWAQALLISISTGSWDQTQVISVILIWLELALRGGILVAGFLLLNHAKTKVLFQDSLPGNSEKPVIAN